MELFWSDPLMALRWSIVIIERTIKEGDMLLVDSHEALLTQLLIARGVYLEVAEDFARGLVAKSPSRTHLRLLADVLQLRGDLKGANEVRSKAEETPFTAEEEATLRRVMTIRPLPDR